MAINYDSLTLTPPRITYARFLGLLKSKSSPAVPEAKLIWDTFIQQGVDPSFALAQYRVESQYGTAGFAKTTKSWGNMLYDSSLTLLVSKTMPIGSPGKFSPGNGYTYAYYDNHLNAAIDYARYLHDYAENRNLPTIYGATAEWIGKKPGSSGHLSYVNTVIQDMYEYEISDGEFYEVGDKMIYAGAPFDRATGKIVQKYPVTPGLTLYRGTDGTVLKQYQGTAGNAWFFGLVQGSTDWGLICIGTSAADPDATLCYIKNVDLAKVVNV